MKKIVTIKKTELKTRLVIDYKPIVRAIKALEEELGDHAPDLHKTVARCIKPTKGYRQIELKNCNAIGAEEVIAMTPHYFAGTQITINGRAFQSAPKTLKDRYTYTWQEFDKTKIPRKLAERNTSAGKTFLEIMQTATGRYIPNACWQEIDKYSKERIEACKEYNETDYEIAKIWYRELIKCPAFKTYASNSKALLEADAEVDFEKSRELLEKGLRPLNEEELRYLEKYAAAYGVQIRTLDYRYDYRKTPYGYTQEPRRIYTAISENEYERTVFDARNNKKNRGDRVPYRILQAYRVKSERNEKLLREAYFELMWIKKHLKDEGLVTGYKRCPICHEIYHENAGCEGHVPPIEQIQTDNLFYGIMNEATDFERPEDNISEEDILE